MQYNYPIWDENSKFWPFEFFKNLENIPGSNEFVREFDSHGKKFSNFGSDLVVLSGWEIHSINIE